MVVNFDVYFVVGIVAVAIASVASVAQLKARLGPLYFEPDAVGRPVQ